MTIRGLEKFLRKTKIRKATNFEGFIVSSKFYARNIFEPHRKSPANRTE